MVWYIIVHNSFTIVLRSINRLFEMTANFVLFIGNTHKNDFNIMVRISDMLFF